MGASSIIGGFGFFAGCVFYDLLWRFANRLSNTLIEEQRLLIAEQDKLIKMLRGESTNGSLIPNHPWPQGAAQKGHDGE